MGRNNQQRRAAKARGRLQAARRRDARQRAGAGDAFGPTVLDDDGLYDALNGERPSRSRSAPSADALQQQRISALLGQALNAVECADQGGVRRAVSQLTTTMVSASGRRMVDRTLVDMLTSAVTAAWSGGWQPADLHRLAGRRLDTGHQTLMVDAMTHELARYAPATIDPRWTAQLAECEAAQWWPTQTSYLLARMDASGNRAGDVLTMSVQVAYALMTLPRLEPLGPLPGQWVSQTGAGASTADEVDERILSRVRALLAKAESTTFEAEAETFTAGAQALMARHSIDSALLAASNPDRRESPEARRIGIDNPYEAPKAMLLDAVADANRCRSVWSRQLGFSTVVGHRADLDAVETLFTSLLVQATTALRREGSRTDRFGRSRTRSFRGTFLTGFASRIRERLAEVTRAETESATVEARSSGADLVPVLAARDQAVDEATQALFPELVQSRLGSYNDAEGWHAGRTVADLAALDVGTALPS